MSRRARSAPKANVSASVRLGLESLAEGNEPSIRAMLSLSADKALVDGLVDCMGVNSLSAEMLMANYFSVELLGSYCKRLDKSEKGGAATLAERIAREWAKPSFKPPPAPSGGQKKRKVQEAPPEATAAKRSAAMADLMAKRAKQAAAAAAGRSGGLGGEDAEDGDDRRCCVPIRFVWGSDARSLVKEASRPMTAAVGDESPVGGGGAGGFNRRRDAMRARSAGAASVLR